MTGYESKRAMAQDKIAQEPLATLFGSLPVYDVPVVDELPAQEPVAWITPTGHIHSDPYLGSIPLYTAPPQRTWVGLTDELQAALWDASRAALPRFHTYATLIEKELRILNT